MAKRQKEWARRAKAALIALLGGECAKCKTMENLEFDVIESVGDEHHSKSQDVRISFCRRQHFENDNIQILCKSCNSSKQDKVIDCRPLNPLLVVNENPF